MKQRDILALMDGIAPGIAASFAKAITPVLARLEAAEKRVAELEKAPGDIDLDAIIAAAVEKALAAQPKAPTASEIAALVPAPVVPTAEEVAALVTPPAAGKDADPEVTRALVDDQVGEAVAALEATLKGSVDTMIGEMKTAAESVKADYQQAIADLPKVPTAEEVRALIPTPENGKDVDMDVVRGLVTDEVQVAVSAIPPAEPGKDASVEQISALLERYLSAHPPKDGESVTVDQLRPLVDETVAKRVAEIPTPKDGVGLAGMLIDRDGELVATLTDGTTKKLGPVVGEDGAVGLGYDEMTEEVAEDGRTVIRRYVRGDQVKEFRHTFAVVLDRGVFKDGTEYVAGDGVTFGGSFWIAQATTKDKPGNSEAWRLAVKKGRDGKDGRDLGPPPPLPKVKL